MEIKRFPWCGVSPLSSASFLKGIFSHHIFIIFNREVDRHLYLYNYAYNLTTLKTLGRDWNRTKYKYGDTSK